jgi:hypothetical protein
MTTMTRTQSPILTINQLVRPRSIVNKKRKAVIAVTQTKIMLLFVLLLICLLIRWSVPCQSWHVGHESQTHFQSYLGTLTCANRITPLWLEGLLKS